MVRYICSGACRDSLGTKPAPEFLWIIKAHLCHEGVAASATLSATSQRLLSFDTDIIIQYLQLRFKNCDMHRRDIYQLIRPAPLSLSLSSPSCHKLNSSKPGPLQKPCPNACKLQEPRRAACILLFHSLNTSKYHIDATPMKTPLRKYVNRSKC